MNNLKMTLLEHEVPFEIIHHEKQIRTAQEGADYFGIEIGQTAATLVIKSEKDFFALIVSGGRGRVNLQKVSGILGCDQLKMATPQEVKQITGYNVGCVSLVLPLPCILDKRLMCYPFVYGGTGEPTSTLKIDPNTIENINQVIAFLD
ncbi:YbaK/EbsC family protein [Bacillus cereus]